MGEARCYLDQVFAGDIFIDHDIQREAIPDHLKWLRANWDDLAMGVIYLSLRDDGKYHCLDGQHRVLAKRDLDPTYIFNALVYQGLTQEQEAKLFLRFNEDRKVVSAIQRFEIHVLVGDEPHVTIKKMLDNMGIGLSTKMNPNRLQCTGRLVQVATEYNLAALRTTLEVIDSAWARSADSWRAVLIGAIARLIYFNAHIDLERLVEVLQSNEPKSWSVIKGTQENVDHDKQLASAIEVRYNRGLRGNARINYNPMGT